MQLIWKMEDFLSFGWKNLRMRENLSLPILLQKQCDPEGHDFFDFSRVYECIVRLKNQIYIMVIIVWKVLLVTLAKRSHWSDQFYH